MSTEDTYLRSVERVLRTIAPEHRAAVLDDLRAHFADASETGQSVDDTIRGLGTPAEIAERAGEEFGTAAGPKDCRAEFAWRVLQWAAVVIAIVTGVVAAFVMPSDIVGIRFDRYTTLADADGLTAALGALIPAALAVVPLVVPRRMRSVVSTCAAALLTVTVGIAWFTLGVLFAPTVLLAWTALIAWARMRGTGFGLSWRIAGGVLTALPALLSLILLGIPYGFGMPRRYADYTAEAGPSVGIEPLGWAFLAAALTLAVLIVVGYRWAGWVLAAIGLVALLVGLTSGGLLTLLFIWLGGFWLTIGLAHAVTATRRP